jgi:hypothetical protein
MAINATYTNTKNEPMNKQISSFLFIAGLIALFFSIVLFADNLKWVGFGIGFTCLLLGILGRNKINNQQRSR